MLLHHSLLDLFHLAECSNRQRAHRSMRRSRISAVKRSHGILSAATSKRCQSSLSRPWSSSLGHGAPPPRISSKYSPPVYVYVHGPRLQFPFQFSPIERRHLLSSHSIVLQSTYKIMLRTSYSMLQSYPFSAWIFLRKNASFFLFTFFQSAECSVFCSRLLLSISNL